MSSKYTDGMRCASYNTRDNAAISKKKLKAIKDNIHVGEEISVPKYTNTGSNYGMSVKSKKATVVSKYDSYVLVTNGKYKWSVNYIDLIYIGLLADVITVDNMEE